MVLPIFFVSRALDKFDEAKGLECLWVPPSASLQERYQP